LIAVFGAIHASHILPMPIPAPNTGEAIASLNDLWATAGHYFDKDDLRVRSIARLARNLHKADAAGAWNVLAGISALTGDATGVIENADRALCLSKEIAFIQAKAGGLSNLGYFSQAAEILRPWLCADVLPMREVGTLAIGTGLIRALAEALETAGNMPTAIPTLLVETVQRAAAIFERHSIVDEDVGKWLDEIGSMLRERRIFFLGQPVLFATEEEEFAQVHLSFIVDVDAEEAARLNVELLERCFTRGVSPPDSFSFGFRSRLTFDARIAA
jgi:hypothetical protein